MSRKTMRNVSGGAHKSDSLEFLDVGEAPAGGEFGWQAEFNRACDRFLREQVKGGKPFSEYCEERAQRGLGKRGVKAGDKGKGGAKR
jgi:hypothetical protein